ncbi:MAG: hypothetical protein JXA06_02100 [Bacteroidetes bacterium]|nr:hypothetical protein [Bacteroidota bacterium]
MIIHTSKHRIFIPSGFIGLIGVFTLFCYYIHTHNFLSWTSPRTLEITTSTYNIPNNLSPIQIEYHSNNRKTSDSILTLCKNLFLNKDTLHVIEVSHSAFKTYDEFVQFADLFVPNRVDFGFLDSDCRYINNKFFFWNIRDRLHPNDLIYGSHVILSDIHYTPSLFENLSFYYYNTLWTIREANATWFIIVLIVLCILSVIINVNQSIKFIKRRDLLPNPRILPEK